MLQQSVGVVRRRRGAGRTRAPKQDQKAYEKKIERLIADLQSIKASGLRFL
jgi:hypothetical protein